MLLFLTGLCIGSIAGMALTALMVTAKKRDELRDRLY
jgi:gas vesicle protein